MSRLRNENIIAGLRDILARWAQDCLDGSRSHGVTETALTNANAIMPTRVPN